MSETAIRALLASFRNSGTVTLPDGSVAPLQSHVDDAGGELLRRAVGAARPRLGVEVGLAFGISTLHILDAFREVGAERLIGMDPAQDDLTWRGGGLHNVRRAGLSDLYEFHPRTSQQVLPELATRGIRIQFAFVDGWHTFDHALVDFFFVDLLLDVGGILVMDDVGYPGIRRACEFIVTNRSYELVDGVEAPRPAASAAHELRRRLKTIAEPLARTDRSPRPEDREREAALGRLSIAAFRKTGDDRRRWDHFTAF